MTARNMMDIIVNMEDGVEMDEVLLKQRGTDESLRLEGGDIDEDKLFCGPSGGDPSTFPHLQYDVYSLRAEDPEIYRKVVAVLNEMAGIAVPEYILEMLQTMHEEFDLMEDKARRLHFDIDNKILKNLQAMHRAQICDRVKGFDLKLAKVMSTLFQHYQNAVNEISDEVLEKLVPSWPDQMQPVPVEYVKILNKPWKSGKVEEKEGVNLVDSEISFEDRNEDTFPEPPPDIKPEVSPLMSIPKPITSQILPFEKSDTEETSQISEQISGFFSPPSVPKTAPLQPSEHYFPPAEEPSMFSDVGQKEKKYSALEYGLTFDIFSPEPKIFSVYLNPKLDYTSEPKEAPADPDSSATEEAGEDSPSEIWKNLKKITTRVTRTLRGNPKYFVTAQDIQADARDH